MQEFNEKNKAKKFMSLLVPNQRRIHAFIAYLVPNRSDAEDILQDTLSEMWNKFDTYEENSNFVAWGTAIARFKIMSHQKRHRSSRLYFDLSTMDLLQTEAESKKGSRYLEMQIDILKRCVKKMSDKEKEYLGLRYEKRLTFRGISEEFGISMQGVHKAISLIHAQLLRCVRFNMQAEDLL